MAKKEAAKKETKTKKAAPKKDAPKKEKAVKKEKVEKKESAVLTKNEMADKMFKTITGLSKDSIQMVIDSVFEQIEDSLNSGRNVQIHKFGTFRVTVQAARTARNPANGETVEVPEKKRISFRPSGVLKSLVNE